MDFTTDREKLLNFVTYVEQTEGDDYEECYELVLQRSQTFSWTPEFQKALVMVGDSIPHEVASE